MSWNLDTKVNNLSLQQVALTSRVISISGDVSSINNQVQNISGQVVDISKQIIDISKQVLDLSSIIIRSASNPLIINNHNISVNDATGSSKGVTFDLLNKKNTFNYSNTFDADVSFNTRVFVKDMNSSISENYVFYNDYTGELTQAPLNIAEPLELDGTQIKIREAKVLNPLQGESGYMTGEQAVELAKATADILTKQDKFEVQSPLEMKEIPLPLGLEANTLSIKNVSNLTDGYLSAYQYSEITTDIQTAQSSAEVADSKAVTAQNTAQTAQISAETAQGTANTVGANLLAFEATQGATNAGFAGGILALGASVATKQNVFNTSEPIHFSQATNVLGQQVGNPTLGVSYANGNSDGVINASQFNYFSGKQDAISSYKPIDFSNNTISIPQANASTKGFLASGDWVTFNNKQSVISSYSPVDFSQNIVSIPKATSSVNGFLASGDWTTFNNKQNVIGAYRPLDFSQNIISIPQVDSAGTNGFLSSVQYTTINNQIVSLQTASISQVYYVSTNGSDTNIGSMASPYLTIQKAVNMCSGSSNYYTIYIAPNTYTENITIGASLSPRISIVGMTNSSNMKAVTINGGITISLSVATANETNNIIAFNNLVINSTSNAINVTGQGFALFCNNCNFISTGTFSSVLQLASSASSTRYYFERVNINNTNALTNTPLVTVSQGQIWSVNNCDFTQSNAGGSVIYVNGNTATINGVNNSTFTNNQSGIILDCASTIGGGVCGFNNCVFTSNASSSSTPNMFLLGNAGSAGVGGSFSFINNTFINTNTSSTSSSYIALKGGVTLVANNNLFYNYKTSAFTFNPFVYINNSLYNIVRYSNNTYINGNVSGTNTVTYPVVNGTNIVASENVLNDTNYTSIFNNSSIYLTNLPVSSDLSCVTFNPTTKKIGYSNLSQATNLLPLNNQWSGTQYFGADTSFNAGVYMNTLSSTNDATVVSYNTTTKKLGYTTQIASYLNQNNFWSGTNYFANDVSFNAGVYMNTLASTSDSNIVSYNTTSKKLGYTTFPTSLIGLNNTWTGTNTFGSSATFNGTLTMNNGYTMSSGYAVFNNGLFFLNSLPTTIGDRILSHDSPSGKVTSITPTQFYTQYPPPSSSILSSNNTWTNTNNFSSGNLYSNNLLLQGNASDAYIRPTNAGSVLYLGSNNTNQLGILSNGNFSLYNSSFNNPKYIISNINADDSAYVLQAGYSGGTYSSIGIYSDWNGSSGNVGKIVFNTKGSERMKINYDGTTNFTGVITSTNGRFTASGTDLRLSTGNGNTVFLNNDKSSGNVNINTGSPNSNVIIDNGYLGIGMSPYLPINISSSANCIASFKSTTEQSSFMEFINNTTGVTRGRMLIGVNGTGYGGSGYQNFGTVGTWTNTELILTTAATEQMRIGIEGNLRFNAYTTNGTLSVVSSNGTVVSSSDVRLKKEINEFEEVDILDKLQSIKPKTYKWINSKDDNLQLGYIAQEMEQVFPFVIDGKKHEYRWEIDENDMSKPKIDESGNIVYKLDASGNKIIRPRGFQDRAFIAYLHLGINALIDENEDLKSQITIQANQITQLQDKITALEDSVALLLSKF
jgi:hypothetical protein